MRHGAARGRPPPATHRKKERRRDFFPRRHFASEVHCLCAIFGPGASGGSRYPEEEEAAAVVVVVVWRRRDDCSSLLKKGREIKVFANLQVHWPPEVVEEGLTKDIMLHTSNAHSIET